VLFPQTVSPPSGIIANMLPHERITCTRRRALRTNSTLKVFAEDNLALPGKCSSPEEELLGHIVLHVAHMRCIP